MPDMRFAPPPAMRVQDRGGGLNQTSVRTYNERLVMSLLRQHDSLSRMDLGQKSGLSAQTISVIVRALERDGLILAGAAQRGRVGPPTKPMFLNPDGALAIGVKIGAYSTDVVLIDFVGAVRAHREMSYAYPVPGPIVAGICDGIEAVRTHLHGSRLDRIVGVGISLPGDIDQWPHPEWGAPASARWQTVDLEGDISAAAGLPTYIQSDVTAAAAAEGTFGAARTLDDFIYFYIGEQSASRVILNHHIYAGRRGVIVPSAVDDNRLQTLTDLESLARAAKFDPAPIWLAADAWPDLGDALPRWIDAVADSLAHAFLAVSGFIDVGSVIVDGRFPPVVRQQIGASLSSRLASNAADPPNVLEGELGFFAEAIGAASLPFHSRFMVEHVGLAPS